MMHFEQAKLNSFGELYVWMWDTSEAPGFYSLLIGPRIYNIIKLPFNPCSPYLAYVDRFGDTGAKRVAALARGIASRCGT